MSSRCRHYVWCPTWLRRSPGVHNCAQRLSGWVEDCTQAFGVVTVWLAPGVEISDPGADKALDAAEYTTHVATCIACNSAEEALASLCS